MMYEQYLSMSAVPAGAILKRILDKKNISRTEISEKSSLYPQKINDLITGKSKFTPEMSLRLEQVLGISVPGYFYKIQANHTVYLYQDEQERKETPDLSKIRQVLFWDSPVDKINWKRDYYGVIKRVFEYGNHREIEEIIRYYSRETVVEVLNSIPKTDIWKQKDREINRTVFKI